MNKTYTQTVDLLIKIKKKKNIHNIKKKDINTEKTEKQIIAVYKISKYMTYTHFYPQVVYKY